MGIIDAKRTKICTYLFDIGIIIFIVSTIMLLVYHQKSIYPFGNGTIAYGDMVQQTIPENLYYMWDVLHGKGNAFFSWNSGLGINLSGAASEQAYLSPLNLFILFSSRENLSNYINILYIIKMIFIAVSMYFYLNKYHVISLAKIGGGILYCFGGASLIHYNIMFVMDMAFLLPVLMIGLDRIFNKRKCVLFILVCALCLMENVYMSFMVLLFILIAGGLHLIYCARQDKGEFAFLLGMSVAVSVMISGVIMLPALCSITKSSRVGNTFLDTYLAAVSSTWTQQDKDMATFMLVSMVFPAAVCIYYLAMKKADNRNYKKQVILAVLLLLPMIVSGTELLWHGGSRISWPIRFVFIISFIIIDFSMQLLQDMGFGGIKAERLGWILAVVMGMLCSKAVCSVILDLANFNKYKESIYLMLTFFLVFGYLFFLHNEKKRVSMAVFLVLFETASMAYLFIAPDSYNTNEYSVHNLVDAQIIDDSLPDDMAPFERVKNSDGSITNVNYSLVMGKESLANYVHVIDASFQTALRKWGYSTHHTRLLDTGGTIFTDTLFGMKYVISASQLPDVLYDMVSECDGSSGRHYYIYKNKYRVPMAVSIEGNLGTVSDNIFENQNLIFKEITGFQENLIEEYNDINVLESTVIEVENKKALYFYGVGNQAVSIKVNGGSILFPSKENAGNVRYPSNFNNNLVCIGCFENQAVHIDFEGVQDKDGIHIGILDIGLFEKGIGRINDDIGKPEISRDNTSMRICLNSKRDRCIFIPVLYDMGWECKVNGNITRAEDAYGFIKICIGQGENMIDLKYVPQGRHIGVWVTIAGIVIGVAFTVIYGTVGHTRRFRYVYNASYAMLIILFGGVLILLYFIPIMKYLQRLLILT